MAEITWTAEAQRWLQDIFDYIAVDNPRAASLTACRFSTTSSTEASDATFFACFPGRKWSAAPQAVLFSGEFPLLHHFDHMVTP